MINTPRRRPTLIALLAATLGLALVALAADPLRTVAAQTPAPTATPTPRPAAYPELPNGLTAAVVVAVIDGDTVDVMIGRQRERLRLIGIDTPEIVHPNNVVQCYGREASERTKALLFGKDVLLEADRSQDSRDRYGRLLRYVWLPDGHLHNLDLIAGGYAFEYTYRTPYRYRETFVAAQVQAREEGRGLWAPSACAGQRAAPTATPAPSATPAPTTAPTPRLAPPAALPPSFRNCAPDPNAARAPGYPLKIVAIDKRAETVTLQNVGPGAIDLGGWVMCSIKGAQRHSLRGTISPGARRVFPHNGDNIWNNSERDPGALYDPQGRLISYWPD